VRVAGLDDAIEVRERAGVEVHLVERLAHEELGALLVLRVVAALTIEHLLELDRCREEVLLVVELDRALERLRGRRSAPPIDVFVDSLFIRLLRLSVCSSKRERHEGNQRCGGDEPHRVPPRCAETWSPPCRCKRRNHRRAK
jgi:hypothetical protein